MFNSAAGYLIPVFFLLCIFGLLLWDMKKVQSLSKLIHDDHVDHWEYIEDESVHGWHSPLDHCMLNLSESGADVKKYKETECAGLTGFGGTEQHNARLYCSIGSSLGKPCSSPLSTRSFFNSQLKSAHLGDPHSRFLSNVSLAIAKSKRPIIFIGDGITKQNQDAFVCELIRSDDVYVTGSMRGEAGQQTSNFTVYWKNSPYKLDVKFIKVTRVNEHGGGGSGMNLRRKIAAASQFADEKGLTGLNRTKLFEQIMNDSTVRLPARIAPPVPFHQLKSLVDDEIDTYGGVVLVANLGVSYNHRENFRTDITDFLAWLNEIGGDNSNDVFFRETAAQHWNHTENGYYSYDIELRRNGSCVPIADNIPGKYKLKKIKSKSNGRCDHITIITTTTTTSTALVIFLSLFSDLCYFVDPPLFCCSSHLLSTITT